MGRAQGFGPTCRRGGGSSRIPTRRRADEKKKAHLPQPTCRSRPALAAVESPARPAFTLSPAKSTEVRQPAVESAASVRGRRWGRSSTARTACSSRGRSGQLNGAAPSRRTSARRSSASPSTVARNYAAFPLLCVPL